MNTLLEINDGSKVCRIHKGELHKVRQLIQETQGTLEGRCFV